MNAEISTASGLLQVAILELRGGSADCFMIKPLPQVWQSTTGPRREDLHVSVQISFR
jgi:hypothetical protein